ncbi:CCAAT-binding transcription factor (CBF-B/NF-YA) subunit B-domain-containing protein [Lobosporangium transversale]|uniref:Transcriptional activator HAP2 n=1 Tax=Lobosporangium transversale TaxID=64571 RepID=A0A1Y2GJ15_9FUNG|nr:CCAAT-binding transcription factor (CBF-B/NF-YA) subunit B-domain-containing protein [Lobosporangium transversale]ORZ12450.1 CCAAT-binding transcription factor (CBF-B/NF-YA) subunit B-domain-containing protein [Lobosporangium transversale]|eukprot:XP_021880069.1 CCAAT-binding transcription factor (CBF-B/NF-YA) subunit B-domain-containing protein [Lobosporangium transversale]
MPPGYVLSQVAPPRVEEPEEPLYVNAKQYHRILKRRAARASLEAENRLQQRGRKFLHLSRHNHAMRRPRGPGGRFLTAAEIAAMQEKERANEDQSRGQQNGDNNNNTNGNNGSTDNHSATSYQAQHHRQQLKQEELYQQQQQQQQKIQQQPQYHQRQPYSTGV